MYYLNQKIENLVRIFDQNERKSYLRLDLNENPGGLPYISNLLYSLRNTPPPDGFTLISEPE